MTVEILCSQLCNLFGDSKNIQYLQLCLPEARFVLTEITDEEPYFARHDVDMVYMGGTTEKGQRRVTEWLRPHAERIRQLIDGNKVFLVTGNALEVFGRHIHNKTTEEAYDGLGLFDLTTEIDLFDRYNGKDLGKVAGVPVVGYRSQFSMVYGDNENECFMRCERGIGIHKKSVCEGVRRKNFMGTHMLGPLLVLNPLLTEYILSLLPADKPRAALREEAMAAYEQRLSEFRNPKTPF